MEDIKIGDLAPDFCLKNSLDQDICLKDFKSKYVVLYFYPRDNTPGCTTEAKEFTDFINDFNSLGAEVVGISADSIKSHVKFIEKHGLKINLLSDPEHVVIEKYGAWQKKKMAGREYYGIVRSTFIINSEGIIVKIWPKVKSKGHAEAVLETLKEIKIS